MEDLMAKVTKLLTKTDAGHTTVKFKVDDVEYSAEGDVNDMNGFERLLYRSEQEGFNPFATTAWHKIKKYIEVKNLTEPQKPEEGEQVDLFKQAVKIAMKRSKNV